MDTAVRKVYPLAGESTITNRYTLDLVPFTACNNKALNVTRKARDGSMTVQYAALSPITDYEAKTILTVAKMCLDAEAQKGDSGVRIVHHDEVNKTPFVNVLVDLHDIAKFLNKDGKDRFNERKNIVASIKRLAGMQVDIETHPNPPEVGRRIVTGWVQFIGIDDTSTYSTMELWISKTMLNIAANDGIAYNLRTAVSFRGRAMLLYLHMQSWKHVVGKLKNGDPKYGYWDYVEHDSIVQALGLDDKPKDKQFVFIRKAFKELNDDGVCNYEYIKHLNKWKKIRITKQPAKGNRVTKRAIG